MSAWNPASGVNTLEQTFRLGEVESRKRYVRWLDGLDVRASGSYDQKTAIAVRDMLRTAIERDELVAILHVEDAP